MKLVADAKTMNDVIILQSKTPFALEDGEYDVEIKPIAKKRSLRQNSMLWKFIGEIAKKEDGDLRDMEALYCRLLELSGAKYEVLYIDHEALESLLKSDIVRHVRIYRQDTVRGRLMDTVFLYYGSSKMDTKEMSQLIDTTLNYAAQLGIYTAYWEEVLKGGTA